VCAYVCVCVCVCVCVTVSCTAAQWGGEEVGLLSGLRGRTCPLADGTSIWRQGPRSHEGRGRGTVGGAAPQQLLGRAGKRTLLCATMCVRVQPCACVYACACACKCMSMCMPACGQEQRQWQRQCAPPCPPRNGVPAVNSSHKVMPKEYTSAALDMRPSFSTSGAM